MKKVFLTVLSMLCIMNVAASAEDHVITSDDFEKYSLTEKYNSGTLTVSYEGMSDATLTDKVIINAPGGMFDGDETYEGNAANNIISYAQTGTDTAIAVPGDLHNGWIGLYSHPMQKLQGGGGASSELNTWNRRLAVVKDGEGQALKFNPAKNSYVHTHSLYGYDTVDFSMPVQWDSDIKVTRTGRSAFTMALTKGKFSQVTLLTYPARENGRSQVTDFIEFTSASKIKIWGEEAGEYQTGKYYTVSVFTDTTVKPAKMKVTITNKEDGSVVADTGLVSTDFDFSGTTGVEYMAMTQIKDEEETEVLVDNIKIYQVVYEPSISGNTNVKIDGTGAIILDFPTKYDPETVTEQTVIVEKNKEKVSLKEIKKQNSNKRVRLLFPELDPTAVYTVKINGITNLEGIVCQWTGEFKTIDIVSVSGAAKTADGVSYTIKNNSANDTAVTVLAVMYKDKKIADNGVCYKKVMLEPSQTLADEFVGMTNDADKVMIYVMDSIKSFKAVTTPAAN